MEQARTYWEAARRVRVPNGVSVAEITDGDARKFTGLIRDITERKEAEERQRGLLIAAESAAAAKAQFLATMSHEIRTPMNGVIGMAALLSSTELDSQQEQYLGAITRSADALLRVIDDVLDFSKIDAGKMTIESRPFDMRETIEDVAILMAAKAREEGIPLYLEISPDLPELLFGDEGRIRQVAINFLGNALKFTHHGRITVKVSAEGEGDMRIVTLSVRDTGIGIAKDKQEAVFEAFTQADGSSTRDYGGTGLGLSICRRLVELMNGSIGVNSELGVGSEFWALLPLQVADSANGTRFDATAVAGSKVLIVDPDEESAAALLGQLAHWDCEVSVTQSVPLDVSEYGTVIADAAAVSEHWPEDAEQSDSTTNFIRIASLHSTEELRRGSRMLFRPIRRSALLEAVLNAGPARLREKTFIESSDASFLGLRVLLAEDDAINQEVTRAMLEGWGCEVTLVETGAGAVEVIASGASIDVVLMDCQMPVMDGLEATRRIRAGERKHDRAATPIVAMTANAMPEDRQRCLDAGMDEYLGKPVKPNALFSMLTAASGVKRQLATPARPPSFERLHAIDQDALRQACLGNEALVTKMVAKFIEAAQQTVQEIEAAISSNSTDEVKRLVHKLKGSSATVYAEALQSALADMEVAIMEGARDEALEKFTEIREELAWLKATVEPAA